MPVPWPLPPPQPCRRTAVPSPHMLPPPCISPLVLQPLPPPQPCRRTAVPSPRLSPPPCISPLVLRPLPLPLPPCGGTESWARLPPGLRYEHITQVYITPLPPHFPSRMHIYMITPVF